MFRIQANQPNGTPRPEPSPGSEVPWKRSNAFARELMVKSPQFKEQNELVRSLRKQLEAADLVLRSRSWRYTYPLRWLARQVRSLWLGTTPSAPKEIQDTGSKPESQFERQQISEDSHRVALRALLSTGAILHLPISDAPEITVILVLSGQAELTLACLRSLREYSLERLQIILVDNASSDETARLLERSDGAHIIRNNQGQNLPVAVNEAARQAHGRYLLLLSNDA